MEATIIPAMDTPEITTITIQEEALRQTNAHAPGVTEPEKELTKSLMRPITPEETILNIAVFAEKLHLLTPIANQCAVFATEKVTLTK